MYQAFNIVGLLINLRVLNDNYTSDSLGRGVGRYIENCVLYLDIYSLATSTPDAVMIDFVDGYAINIMPKSTNPDQDGFNYFSISNVSQRRDKVLLDLGDDYLYRNGYGVGVCTSIRKWNDLVGNNRQMLDLMNLKRYRIGSVYPLFQGVTREVHINDGDITLDTTTPSGVNGIALESSFNVSVSNSGVESSQEKWVEDCTAIAISITLEATWAEKQSMIFSEKIFETGAGIDIEVFDSKIVNYDANEIPFDVRSTKPTGVPDGESKRTAYESQRTLTIMPEYTLPELITLMNVPY